MDRMVVETVLQGNKRSVEDRKRSQHKKGHGEIGKGRSNIGKKAMKDIL